MINANTEKDQIQVLSILFSLSKTFDIDPNKQLIMAGYFNIFFNVELDAAGGNPTLKRKSLAKLLEHEEAYKLFDIWRIRNVKENDSLLLSNIYLVLFITDLITCIF